MLYILSSLQCLLYVVIPLARSGRRRIGGLTAAMGLTMQVSKANMLTGVLWGPQERQFTNLNVYIYVYVLLADRHHLANVNLCSKSTQHLHVVPQIAAHSCCRYMYSRA